MQHGKRTLISEKGLDFFRAWVVPFFKKNVFLELTTQNTHHTDRDLINSIFKDFVREKKRFDNF